jgi:hypothetical protein
MKLKVLILIFVLGSSSCKDKMIAIPEDSQIPLTGILSTLKKDHPRLMLSLSQVEEIKLKNDFKVSLVSLDRVHTIEIARANGASNDKTFATELPLQLRLNLKLAYISFKLGHFAELLKPKHLCNIWPNLKQGSCSLTDMSSVA